MTSNFFFLIKRLKKLPRIIFEYRCAAYFGISYAVILFADGTLVKYDYGNASIGYSEKHIIQNDEIILKNPELSQKVKIIIKSNYKKIKGIEKNIYNPFVLDGAEETICFGRKKFQGYNIRSISKKDWEKNYNKNYEGWNELMNKLFIVQDIFNMIKEEINFYSKDCL